MYCRKCGAKISDDAKFCGSCGTRVVRQGGHDAEQASDVPSESGVQPEPADQPDELPDVQANQRPETDEQLESNSEPAEPRRSLKDSLIQFRRTTLRAVPTFVLAIVALMAAAGTAYAAYKLVTEVIIPAIEQVAGNVSDDVKNEPSDSTQKEKTASVNEANEEAHTAYNQVLDDYRSLMAENEEKIAEAGDNGTYIDSMDGSHQWAWTGDFFFARDTNILYAYLDVDGDSVDELFISFGTNGELNNQYEQSTALILCGFDYFDGEIYQFAESIERGHSSLTKSGAIVRHASGGFDVHLTSLSNWDGQELVVKDEIYIEPVDNDDRGEPDSQYRIHKVIDGVESEEIVPWDSVDATASAFESEYIEDGRPELEWHILE